MVPDRGCLIAEVVVGVDDHRAFGQIGDQSSLKEIARVDQKGAGRIVGAQNGQIPGEGGDASLLQGQAAPQLPTVGRDPAVDVVCAYDGNPNRGRASPSPLLSVRGCSVR